LALRKSFSDNNLSFQTVEDGFKDSVLGRGRRRNPLVQDVMRASLLTSMFDSLISPSTQFAACNAATEALKLKVASFLG
jgi:hypothetical protein